MKICFEMWLDTQPYKNQLPTCSCRMGIVPTYWSAVSGNLIVGGPLILNQESDPMLKDVVGPKSIL